MIRAVAAAALAAGPALADCPEAADLDRGVILTRDDPFFSNLYTREAGGLTERRVDARGGAVESLATVYAHPLAAGERRGADGAFALDYNRDVAELDRLDVTGVWLSEATLFVGGVEAAVGVARIAFVETARETVGGCAYDVWIVESRLELEDRPAVVLRSRYAPELGLVLRSERLGPDGAPTGGVRYDAVAVADPT